MRYSKEERELFRKYLCKNKIQYFNRDLAWKSALYYFTKLGHFQSVYKCPHCQKFHLTNKRANGGGVPPSYISELADWFGLPLGEFEKVLLSTSAVAF